VPHEVCRLAPNRFVVAGRAHKGAGATEDALVPKSAGQTAGYLLVVDWKSP
jgi:hypothetical protein